MSFKFIEYFKKKFFSNLLLFLAGVLVLFLLIGIVREYWREREIQGDLMALQTELARLEAEKQGFLQSLDLYQSEYFLEKEARTQFNLRKEGEQVAVVALPVVFDSETKKLGAKKDKKFFYGRIWWDYFFGEKS